MIITSVDTMSGICRTHEIPMGVNLDMASLPVIATLNVTLPAAVLFVIYAMVCD